MTLSNFQESRVPASKSARYIALNHGPNVIKLVLLASLPFLSLTSCELSSSPANSTTTSAAGLVGTIVEVTPTLIDTPIPPISTASLPPSQISSTATPTPLSLEALDPGQYIVISKILPASGDNYIYESILIVISMEGEEFGNLSIVQGKVALASDQTTIAYWHGGDFLTEAPSLKLRNLVDQHEYNVEIGRLGVSQIAWAPDGDQIAFADKSGIAILDLTSLDLVQVLNCTTSIDQAAYCVVLGWSPNGKWIVHRVDITRSGSIDPKELTYLLDTTCFSDINSCASLDYSIMPFRTFGSWSPDGQYFAGAGTDGDVYVFDVASWEVDRILHTGRYIESIHWSPDGQWLGFSSPRGIGLISPETGDWKFIWEASLKEDVTLAFWLSVGE